MPQQRKQMYSEGEAIRKLRLNGINNNILVVGTEDLEYQLITGFTLACVIIPEDISTYQHIISKQVPYSVSQSGENRSLGLYLDPSRNNSLVLEMFGIDYSVKETVIPYRLDNYNTYQIVLSYNFTTGIVKYTINEYSDSSYIAPFTLNKSSIQLVIGDTHTPDTRPVAQPFKGTISNLSFWKKILSTSETTYILSSNNKNVCQLKAKGVLSYNDDDCLIYSTLNYTIASPINLSAYSYNMNLRGTVADSPDKNKKVILFNNRIRYTIAEEPNGYGNQPSGYGNANNGGVNTEFLA